MILAGILCVPGGAAAGYLVHVAARTPLGESVFFGAFACVVVYNVLVWSYIFIFVRERVHWRLSFFGFVFGFDPRGINISPGREWWRFKLLLKQALGAKER